MKTMGWLHAHLGPGKSNKLQELAAGLDKTLEAVGKNVFRDNARTFFQLVEECWGVRNVVYKGAVHLRGTFLRCLARLLSDNHKFFFKDGEGRRLFIDADTMRKLKAFPVRDPQVVNLASSGGMGGNILYGLMVKHVNRGRRSRRLVELENTTLDTPEPNGSGSEEPGEEN